MADEITLLESFDRGRDGWRYYDTYDPVIRAAIHDQRHVDFRDFTGYPTEIWNNDATVAPRPENGNLKSFRTDFSVGGFSVGGSRGDFATVDLVTGFESDDHFSVSFPNFPLSKINLASSYIRLGSYTGSFENSKSIFLPLDQSTVPLVNGNSEYRVPLSSLDQGNDFDPTKVKTLFFWFVATASGTLDINAMRTLDKNWKSSGLGINTLDGSLGRVPDRTGGTTTDFAQPILWHAAEPSGSNDPRPIDADFVVPFHTSVANTGTNRISLYFREVTEDFMTQLDLDGMTMAELDGKDQPDIGDAKYNQRTVGELNRYKLSELDGETIFSLERTPDFLSASWIEFTLQWGAANSITIQDTEGNGYNFIIPALTANSNYVFATYLEEHKVRAALYLVDYYGNYTSTIFDTTLINDDSAFQRRKGRAGWYANLNDGDARILAFAPNGITYAEYRSHPYASQTPVIGAELFASNSPSNELFEEFQAGTSLFFSDNAVPVRDTTKSLSGESWKITTLPESPTAVVTQTFVITDYPNSVIEFDVFIPSDIIAEGINLTAMVLGQNFGESYPLITPVIFGDQWQHVKIDFLFGTPAILPGKIQIQISLDSIPTAPGAFWIDNMSVRERTVVWDGRAVVDDPWKSNDARWQPFRDNYARENGGIVFNKRGANLQVRGRARKQTATISRVQYKPRYAELGRMVDRSLGLPPTYEFVNSLVNPNGNTTTGWQTGTAGNTLTAVTDGGSPSLLDTITSGFSASFQTAAIHAIPHVAGATYGVGGTLRSTSSITGQFGIVLYNASNTTQFTTGPFLTPPIFGEIAGYAGTYLATDLQYFSVTDTMIAATGYPNVLVGLFFQGFGGPPTWTIFARTLTLIQVLPSTPLSVLPVAPFDGNSTNAAWIGPAPNRSKLTVNPFYTNPVPSYSVTNVGLAATLTATANKPIINYEWNFGDGEKGLGPKVVHTYPVSGVYPVTLVATDQYGNQGTYANTVAV